MAVLLYENWLLRVFPAAAERYSRQLWRFFTKIFAQTGEAKIIPGEMAEKQNFFAENHP
jgi:hypothetical protein